MKKQHIIVASIVIIGCILGMIYTYYTPNITRTTALCIGTPLFILVAYFSAIMNPNVK